jgi:hypothetical protein
VVVEDMRRDDTYMRVTWHAESRVFVVSHWSRDVCVAATRIPVEAAPDLIQVLVRGLAESSSAADAPSFEPRARFGERTRSAAARWWKAQTRRSA